DGPHGEAQAMKLPAHIKRLLGMLKPYKGRLLLAFVGMIITAGTEPMFPAILRPLLDKGFTGKPSFSLWLVPVAIIGIFVIRGISTFATNYSLTCSTSRLLNTLRQQMLNGMLCVRLNFYNGHPVGRFINSMMFEVHQASDMVGKI